MPNNLENISKYDPRVLDSSFYDREEVKKTSDWAIRSELKSLIVSVISIAQEDKDRKCPGLSLEEITHRVKSLYDERFKSEDFNFALLDLVGRSVEVVENKLHWYSSEKQIAYKLMPGISPRIVKA